MQLWPICFKLSAALLLAAVPFSGSTVGGILSVRADGAHSNQHRNFSDIVVWLEPLSNARTIPVESQHVRLLQKNKTFSPHVLAITVGSTVDFPNADPIFHNAFSNYDGQLFDVGLYPPGTNRTVRFRRPGIVRVFCNIHPSMSAVILVLDTPYFTKASADGRYQILKVPPGRYELRFFDEQATEADDKPTVITVGDEPETRGPEIQISEVGYVSHSHKNKYGKEYPPNADSYGNETPPQ